MTKESCGHAKSKKWYTSKTIWFNIIVLLMGSLRLISDVYAIPPEVLGLVFGIGNLVLRFLTVGAIHIRKS